MGHSGRINNLVVMPDSHHAVSVSEDRSLKIWDLETGGCLATWSANDDISVCSVTPDIIVAGTERGEVLFLKLMPPGRITS